MSIWAHLFFSQIIDRYRIPYLSCNSIKMERIVTWNGTWQGELAGLLDFPLGTQIKNYANTNESHRSQKFSQDWGSTLPIAITFFYQSLKILYNKTLKPLFWGVCDILCFIKTWMLYNTTQTFFDFCKNESVAKVCFWSGGWGRQQGVEYRFAVWSCIGWFP